MNTFFPFTFKILNYVEKECMYIVEYTASDPELSKITFHLRFGIEEVANQELVLKMIRESSPQFQWNNEKIIKERDHTPQKSLVGKSFDINENPISTNQINSPPSPVAESSKLLTDEEINKFIDDVLKSQG